jgi:hypothetical protein
MADFTFPIHRCTPGPKEYNVLSTTSEGWKVKTRMKTTHPRQTWNVEIRGRTDAEKDSIVSHYDGQGANNVPFNWVVTPVFFAGGTPTTRYVRYKEFSWENPDGLGNIWNFAITFVQEVV